MFFWLPLPSFILTIENYDYIAMIKDKLAEIKNGNAHGQVLGAQTAPERGVLPEKIMPPGSRMCRKEDRQ